MYDRDALIAATDLRALADELLGCHAGTERSPSWHCPNPCHAQTGRTPPVRVFTSRRGEQRWRCHGCGAGGTAIDLLMACRGVDLRHAIEDLAARAGPGVRLPTGPSTRAPAAQRAVLTGCADPVGLNAYVTSCARRLWRPEGRAIRTWLMERRGLPEDVLLVNHIGADLGPGRQARPDGMCRTAGVMLPVVAGDRVIYAQVRVPHPKVDRPRYLNPSADLAPNPRLAQFRPNTLRRDEVLITEGAIDALSAAAAGYRSVAILSAGYPDRSVAHVLSRLPHPLVIAFDADNAGRLGAERLQSLLAAEHRTAARLDLGQGDLNDALVHSRAWGRELAEQVHAVRAPTRLREVPSVDR